MKNWLVYDTDFCDISTDKVDFFFPVFFKRFRE